MAINQICHLVKLVILKFVGFVKRRVKRKHAGSQGDAKNHQRQPH